MDESIKRNAIPIKTQSLDPTVSYGCCMFCGQSFAIETIGEGGNQKKLDKHATRKCKCSEAREWVKFENSKERTEKKIKELFESDCTITEILISNIETVAKRDIAKITIDSGAGYKGSLSVTPKGSLKVEKNISKKITWEVE